MTTSTTAMPPRYHTPHQGGWHDARYSGKEGKFHGEPGCTPDPDPYREGRGPSGPVFLHVLRVLEELAGGHGEEGYDGDGDHMDETGEPGQCSAEEEDAGGEVGNRKVPGGAGCP